ncbi:MAG: hypothetical protein RLZZ265_2560 [Verrucomicrobiota bacterium]
MTAALLLAIVASQVCLVTGELLMKRAMDLTNENPVPWPRFVPRFAAAIICMSGWFFLWGGLLQRADLSFVYPFEGLSPVLVMMGASIFLKEKLTTRTWLGILLIGFGVALVSAS